MKRLKSSATDAGYDQEEFFFYKRDRELLKGAQNRPKLTLIQGGKSNSQEPSSSDQKSDTQNSSSPPPNQLKKVA